MERNKVVSREKCKQNYEAADRLTILWPLDHDITNKDLGLILSPDKYKAVSTYVEPENAYIHRELAKRGVTMTFLWEEYCS